MEPTKNNRLIFAFVLTLTLGLAPFVPEPHIVGKVRWVLGGAKGMQPIDYFDLVMHVAPWVYLIYQLAIFMVRRKK
jgi:hypothetical protein